MPGGQGLSQGGHQPGPANYGAAVGTLAARFAAPLGWGEVLRLSGQLHDVGKASREFQDYIAGDLLSGGDHSSAGSSMSFPTRGVDRNIEPALACVNVHGRPPCGGVDQPHGTGGMRSDGTTGPTVHKSGIERGSMRGRTNVRAGSWVTILGQLQPSGTCPGAGFYFY